MMRVIRFPPLLVALMVCVAVSGCNKKTGKKPKIELGIHELTVAQGATEVIGANRTVVKVQGDHSGLSVMPQEWGGDIHITATKDAKEGSYDFIFSDEDGNTDTLKVTVTKAEPSAGSSSASQGSSNKHKIAEFPSGVSDWKPDQAIVNDLGEEQPCPRYRIRPPKGYKLSEFSKRQLDSPVGGNFLFQPDNRPGFHPTFVVETGKGFGNELEQDPDSAFDKSVAQMKESYKFGPDFTRKNTDYVRINGFGWRRCQFSGTSKVALSEEKCKGLYYQAADDNWSISLYAIVPEADQEILKRVEAAVYTLKK